MRHGIEEGMRMLEMERPFLVLLPAAAMALFAGCTTIDEEDERPWIEPLRRRMIDSDDRE